MRQIVELVGTFEEINKQMVSYRHAELVSLFDNGRPPYILTIEADVQINDSYEAH